MELAREKYSGTESVLDARARIASNVNLYTKLNGLSNRFGGYECFMIVNEKESDQIPLKEKLPKLASYTVPKLNLKDLPRGIGKEEDGIGLKKSQQIIDKEDDYRKRRLNRIISPNRRNVFSRGNRTLDVVVQT
jgi:splicing factor 3B subunit 1